MRIRTCNTVVLGGVYHAPGTALDVERTEAERLIALRAAVAIDEDEPPVEGTDRSTAAPRRRKREPAE
jgi:hypothetical protein